MRVLTLLACLTSLVLAQPYAGKPKSDHKPQGMPFVEQMKYRTLDVKLNPQSAGASVRLSIHRGKGRPKTYTEKTNAQGVAHFARVPTNVMIQQHLRYEVSVDHDGVRFPFELQGIPGEDASVELQVPGVTRELSSIEALHNIDIHPDEDALVVQHRILLFNGSDSAVDLSTQPGGGLKLPCPAGAKHPQLHDEHDPTAEIRGTAVFYTGALLPASHGPKVLRLVYTLPYATKVFEWSEALPVRTRGATVAVPKHRLKGMQGPVTLELATRSGLGTTSTVEEGDRSFQVLRTEGTALEPGEPLVFAVGGIPAPSDLPLLLVAAGVLAVLAAVLLGFRPETDGKVRLSREHLIAERDRLVRALARMRRAVERGKLSEVRFEREREAITARLVSLYRALDRLDARG